MFKEAIKQIKIAFLSIIVFTLFTGLIYPLITTGLAQLLFPWQANGSMLSQNGKTIGSLLIGQSFDDPKYFWGRPSATSPFPYNGESSSGSNWGPSNPDFINTVKERVSNFKKYNSQQAVPIDLVTASGSGLDPEISPLAALYQVSRIAIERHIAEAAIRSLIQAQIRNRSLLILGEPRINVLQLNLALDKLRSNNVSTTS